MMQHEGHVRILKSLKLFGMAHAIEELGNQNSPAFNQALPMLDSLIKAEVAEREVRSVNYQLRVAKFAHQAFNRTSSHANALAIHLLPDLASTIDAKVLLPDSMNLRLELFVALGPLTA